MLFRSIYSQWKDTQEQFQARFDDMQRQALREDLLSGKTNVGALRKQGMTDDQIRELVMGKRLETGQDFEFPGPRIIFQTGSEPDLETLKRAAEIRKRQLDVERESRQAALEAGGKGQPGFAKEIAEMNARIEKWTTFTDDKGASQRVALTRQAWQNVLDELGNRWSDRKSVV